MHIATFSGAPGHAFARLGHFLRGSFTRRIFPFLLLWALPALLTAQDLQWAKQIGGTGPDYAHSITLDASGNVYVVGNFSGTADFDPGAGVFNLGPSSGTDVFFAKYTPSGDLLWAKALIGGATDNALGIAVSGSSVYITGTFAGTLDFDPGAGAVTRNGGATDSYDLFIAKYNAGDGSYAWVRTVGQAGSGSSRGEGIAVDGSGNLYVTGQFIGTGISFGNANLTHSGSYSAFLAKYDANNTPLWAKHITPGAGGGTGYEVAVDNSGSAYVTGAFLGTTDFDPVLNPPSFPSPTNRSSAFVAKYNSSGTYQWANKIDAYGGTGFGIAVNGAGSTLAVTGRLYPSASASLQDIFIRQYSGSSNSYSSSWTKSIGGSQSDEGFGVALDAAGNVYATGNFISASVDFNPGGTPFTLTNSSNGTLYLAKYNGSGACQYAKGVGTSVAGRIIGLAATSDGSSIYLSGSFSGTVNFSTCGGTFNMTASSDDAFFAKYSASPLPVSAFVQGPSVVCTSGSTFTLQNAPIGAAVTWTASSNLTPASGSGTTAAVSAVSGTSGSGSVTFTVNACTPFTVSKSVTVGLIPSDQVKIYYWGSTTPVTSTIWAAPGSYLNFEAPHFDNVTYEWKIVYPTPGYVIGNSRHMGFQMFDTENKLITIILTVTNACGTSGGYAINITNRMSSYYAVYPNPAVDEVTIETVENGAAPEAVHASGSRDSKPEAPKQFDVIVYDKYAKVRRTGKTQNGKLTLPLADLPEGLYQIRITNQQGAETKSLFIKH